MNSNDFTSAVRHIPLDSIDASTDNPRGKVEKDTSFERLVSSINEVGLLVPLVVRKTSGGRYELVDGERRFLAAQQLRFPKVPAHVLSTNEESPSLRKFMFHLHMTREQWGALAQCKSLAEMYPALQDGIKLDEKPQWAKRIAEETWMNAGTARDRVHVLAWPKSLKKQIYKFDEEQPDRDVYSYILAIEASIIEPSARSSSFDSFYRNGSPVDKKANTVRGSLLSKTLVGITAGSITSRDQIRAISPLFQHHLGTSEQKTALKIFVELVNSEELLYDDALSQIQTRLPELLAEKPPKTQKLIGLIKSLSETLKLYTVHYIDDSVKRESQRRRLKLQLKDALVRLIHESIRIKDSIK